MFNEEENIEHALRVATDALTQFTDGHEIVVVDDASTDRSPEILRGEAPREIDEAAVMDGCGPWRIYWRIMLPLSTPGLVATFLFVLVFAWNEYLIALFLTNAKAQTLPLTVAAQNDI